MTEPFQLTREPDPQEALDALVGGHVAEVHTAIPGRIERYDPDKCQADVLPLLKRKYVVDGSDGEITEQVLDYPVIPNVPVAFPRGGGFAVTFPLKKGDPVLLVFAERSLDAYLDSDGASVVDPDDSRRHHLSDAICYPGMTTFANPAGEAHASNMVVGLEDGSAHVQITPGGEVHLKAGKVRHGTDTASKALALAEKVDARLAALETQVTLPHGSAMGPTVPPPFVAGGTPPGASTASTRVFTDA